MWLARLCILSALTVGPAAAQSWLLVEVRDLPGQCTRPISCMGQSELALRNLIHLHREDRNSFLQLLNSAASIRGLSEEDQTVSNIDAESMIAALHPIPKAQKLTPLINHPGVFFDPTALDAEEATNNFSPYIREQLNNAGVRFLTKEEWENTPGRPTLSVRYSKRTESAGCIIPFSVSLSISEETVMVRNPSLKVNGSTWSGQSKENLANLNFTPMSALVQVVENFVKDWTSQNPQATDKASR